MFKIIKIIAIAACITFSGTTASFAESDAESDFQEKLRAAEQGDAVAEWLVGYMFQYGKGVGQDIQQAVAWYTKAAEQGDADAQNSLGLIYQFGEGVVQKNVQNALFWFTKAAKQGNEDAQISLGKMYEKGDGVRQDELIAKEWYGKACDNGEEDGCKACARLNKAGF